MDLERIAITLRRRNSWEAIDLGLRFALQNAGSLYRNWFAVTLPVAALVFLVLGLWLGSPAWAVLLLWWLKPVFDRVAAHVLSRALFGESTQLRDTLAELPRLLWRTRLLRNLSIGRFSLCRSILLPVDVLEGLSGKAASQRKGLISRRISGAASWQTLAWMHLETLFWLGFWALIGMLVPHELFPEFEWLDLIRGGSLPDWLYWCAYAPLWLASLLLEPLYVAGGFMLYLKRRTDLEAWDVELQFRRLAQGPSSRPAGALPVLLCALCIAVTLLQPAPASAADAAVFRETASEQAPGALKEVLQQAEFGKEETDYRLRWLSDGNSSSARKWPAWLKDSLEALGSVLGKLGDLLAWLGRTGGWLLIIAVVALLVWFLSRVTWRGGRAAPTPPSEIAGFDIRPQTLPDDIPAAIEDLLRQGDKRGALSLLFRGSLSRLAYRAGVPFARGDTEGDCLRRVRQHAPELSGFMSRLLGCWQQYAYAHQEIGMEEIRLLGHEWAKTFSAGVESRV